MNVHSFELTTVFDINAHFQNAEILTFDIGQKEEILLHTREDNAYYLYVFKAGELYHRLRISMETCNFQFVDDTYILTLDSSDDTADVVYINLQGEVLNTFPCGCTISGFRAMSLDEVWIGYADESVSDGYDYGLYCHNRRGEVVYHYEAPGGIIDCYSINLSKNKIWVHHYADSGYYLACVCAEIRQIKNYWHLKDNATVWGFTVSGRGVLFAGFNRRIELQKIRLLDHHTFRKTYSSMLNDGRQKLVNPVVKTRGDTFYFLEHGRIYKHVLPAS